MTAAPNTKSLFKQFQKYRQDYNTELENLTRNIEESRNKQQMEKANADQALTGYMERLSKLTEDEKLKKINMIEQQEQKMQKQAADIASGGSNMTFLTRFSNLNERKSLLGGE